MATAVVDLNAITSNLAAVRSLLQPDTVIMPAVKADAYGHGSVRVVRALQEVGVDWFAVATAGELLKLHRAGISANLLLLTPAMERLAELFEAGAVFTLPDHATLERFRYARAPTGTRVHLKVDTGLGRLGVQPEETAGLAQEALKAGLVVEGVFTHFASAESDPGFTALQRSRFDLALEQLKATGIEPRFRHLSNSAGILDLQEAGGNMVRPGILIYGYPPAGDNHALTGKLQPSLTLLAPVTQVKRVAAGQGLGYNHLYTTSRDTNILTVRCGYADGYRRLLSDKSWASLHGQRLEQRGRIAMDQLLLEAGDLEVQPGEIVTLLGGRGPGADELGAAAGSNAYDILTSLTSRVSRQYVRNNP